MRPDAKDAMSVARIAGLRAPLAGHSGDHLGLFEGMDGWNPVFLKDLAAALRGKLPAVILGICLAAVLLIAFDIRFVHGLDGGENFSQRLAGRSTAAMMVLSAVLVPLQAFVTTVMELRDRAAYDLSLAGASAQDYVFGRILFASVEILLIASLFAPLFAFSHTLGGVYLTDVVLGIGGALVFGLPLTALAISLAVQARFKLIGSLLPMLFLTGFWMVSAAVVCGTLVTKFVGLLPSHVETFIGPVAYSGVFTSFLSFPAIVMLGMPGDRWSGAFSSVSAASVRKRLAKMREKSDAIRSSPPVPGPQESSNAS